MNGTKSIVDRTILQDESAKVICWSNPGYNSLE